LYIFQGSIVIGSVSVVSQSISDASNGSSDNSLWHLCVSHMSEKGLDILNKRCLFGNHKVESLQFCEHCLWEEASNNVPKGYAHNEGHVGLHPF